MQRFPISEAFMSRPTGKRRPLAVKLSLLVLASTSLIFGVAGAYNYSISRQAVLRSVEENARSLTLATANKIEAVLLAAEKVPRYYASSLERQRYGRFEVLEHVRRMVTTNPQIFGAAVAFEPRAFDEQEYYFCPYFCRYEDQTKLIYLQGPKYDYFYWDWYMMPKELGHPTWSEPYNDEGGGNVIMSTFSAPFSRERNGKWAFAGVVTADLSLEWLQEMVEKVSIYRSGYAFLISQNGAFVTHPDKKLLLRESIFSVAEALGEKDLRRIGREMIWGQEGFVRLDSRFTGKKAWMYYAPLKSVGWSLALVIPEEELFAGLNQLTRRVLVIAGGGFAILFLVVILISNTITRPIRRLALKTAEIARGGLDVELPPPRSRDEVGELSTSFENMRLALKEYIQHLAETTAAKERIESELKIARTIQMSFLPKHFPPFPEKKEFDIYAALEPAREVGGDLYDFFLLDDEHLFFSIGDVSGKGVPSALFMVVAKVLMKGTAAAELEISEVLRRVNRELCRENESMMFVTVFCGILNFRTGELSYSNAGHNPPLLLQAGGVRWLPLPAGVFLGVNEEAVFETMRVCLDPGDGLVLYTDGVTEAVNPQQAAYGEEALMRLVNQERGAPAERLVRTILGDVQAFAGGGEQYDDLTILALRYLGKAPEKNS